MHYSLTGNIFIEGDSVGIQLGNGIIIALDDSYLIEVMNGSRFETASIATMLQAKDDRDQPIYAGLYAVAQLKKVAHTRRAIAMAKKSKDGNRLVEISKECTRLSEETKRIGSNDAITRRINELIQERDSIIEQYEG